MTERKTEVEVAEKTRQIVSISGASLSLHNVTSFDSSRGKNLRLQCDEGYVIVNENNVLAMIIDGKRIRG
jgi:hypothetical protein